MFKYELYVRALESYRLTDIQTYRQTGIYRHDKNYIPRRFALDQQNVAGGVPERYTGGVKASPTRYWPRRHRDGVRRSCFDPRSTDVAVRHRLDSRPPGPLRDVGALLSPFIL